VADNPLALASLADLVVSLVLRGIPHNYLERLESGPFGAVPAYVRRAEEFMRANAAVPIRMEHAAAAAGCSVRTLDAVFRQFRETTPLATLHHIRLEQVHAELHHPIAGASIAEVSRAATASPISGDLPRPIAAVLASRHQRRSDGVRGDRRP
jgi:transcriptional regulator GlxA family with amidase domain